VRKPQLLYPAKPLKIRMLYQVENKIGRYGYETVYRIVNYLTFVGHFMLKECSKEKKYPRILIGHYPLLDEHPISRIRHRLFGQQKVLNLLKTKALDISLCGHVHWPSAKLDETGRGEICAGSITKNNCLSLLNYIPDNDVFTQECHYLEKSV